MSHVNKIERKDQIINLIDKYKDSKNYLMMFYQKS